MNHNCNVHIVMRLYSVHVCVGIYIHGDCCVEVVECCGCVY